MRLPAVAILGVIAVNAVVLPNAQQMLLATALVGGASLGLFYRGQVSTSILAFLVASSVVTLFYALVGQVRGATGVALMQTIIIYIVSPVLWILVIDLAWKLFGVDRVVRSLGILAVLAAASVALYIFLHETVGPHAVVFFSNNVNVHLEEGYSGVRMHVSGSLVFLGAAFAAEPGVIRSRILSISLLICLALAALASGRTAAIMALAIGSLILFVGVPRQMLWRLALGVPLTALAGIMVKLGMEVLLGVDLLQLLTRHLQKVLLGDFERPAQIAALINGAQETWFLGAGHGIGVDYLRSAEFPWRYEAVFFALLYKLGIAGFLVVVFPILYALTVFLYRLASGSVKRYDAFFGSALIACLIAGVTNPYPEAFAFQWMYLLPTYHFLTSHNGEPMMAPRHVHGPRRPIVSRT